jgi:hypothetical protein
MRNDVWFSAVDNLNFVKKTLKKDFVMPLKSNRKLALSLSEKKNGRHQTGDTLELEPMNPVIVYLESVEFALLLVKQVFTYEDGSTGILDRVTSHTTLSGDSSLQSIKNDGTSSPITNR